MLTEAANGQCQRWLLHGAPFKDQDRQREIHQERGHWESWAGEYFRGTKYRVPPITIVVIRQCKLGQQAADCRDRQG
jgi:hypothetical protein